MEVDGRTRTWDQVVRWTWVVVLGFLTLVGLALAPASGLLSLPFALTTGGLALWLGGGGPQQGPGKAGQWLVAVGVVGMLFWFILLVVACTDSSSGAGGSTVPGSSGSVVSGLDEPTEFIRLGLTIDSSDQIHVLIPACPNAQVVAVGWVAPSELYSIWSAARSSPGVDLDEVVLGVVPDGFEMGTPLESEYLSRWSDRKSLIIVGWDGRDGSDGFAGAASVEPSELHEGSILYGAGSTEEIRYESRAEYERAADCELYPSA